MSSHLSAPTGFESGHKPSGHNQCKQSMCSHRSSRAPSGVEFDDDQREESHLKEHNAKMQQRIKAFKKTIRGLKEGAGGDISAANEKSIETLNAESQSYQADINEYKEKARKVNNIELLDTLIDDLANCQLQMKGLELQKRQVSDSKRADMKTLAVNEESPSRQKVFLDLKDERRRQNTRLYEAQEQKERLSEQINLIQGHAEKAMAKVEDLGLTDVEVPSVINMKKKKEEQVKQIEKLRQQIGAINGSLGTMKTRTNWADRDKDVVLEDMRAEIAKVKAQIAAKEQVIMGNKNTEKPPHRVPPLATSPSAEKKKPSPRNLRPTPPKENRKPAPPKEEQKKVIKPKPPAKKKEEPRPAPPPAEKKEEEEDTYLDDPDESSKTPPTDDHEDTYSDKEDTYSEDAEESPKKEEAPAEEDDAEEETTGPVRAVSSEKKLIWAL